MQFNPYLLFEGNCEEAMEFYKDIFNATISNMMRYSETSQTLSEENHRPPIIMHASLTTNDFTLMLSDNIDAKYKRGTNTFIFASINDEKKAEDYFFKLADGGHILVPYEIVFWGGKFGKVIDKFGINWMIRGGSEL